MDEVLRTLIPVIGVSIPLVVVAGRFIVQPIVSSLTRLSESQKTGQAVAPLQSRLESTEQRLEQLERQLDRVIEEQQFQRSLLSNRSTARVTANIEP
jgi:hypothetical protein